MIYNIFFRSVAECFSYLNYHLLFLFKGLIRGIWKFLGPGTDLHNSSDPSRCSDNSGSLIPLRHKGNPLPLFYFILFVFFFFFLFRAASTAHGGSQARDIIGAVAAGLCNSQSNAGSEPSL